MPEHKFFDVRHCVRCGEDHAAMEFHQIVGTPEVDADGTVWNWWGVCPVTGDPVRLTEGDKVDPAKAGTPPQFPSERK